MYKVRDEAVDNMNTRIRVAFYLDNRTIEGRNLKDVEAGNPGIGGSHYMQLLTEYHLAQQYGDLDIFMYVTTPQDFPEGIRVRVTKGFEHALSCMKEDHCRVLVLSNWYTDLGDGNEVPELIEKYRIRTILWAHIFMNYRQYAFISSCKYIRLFVCLGKQQLEMLRGLRLYKKATYINYMLPPTHMLRGDHYEKLVVYVGALYPFKGFHILAKHWKYIKKKVPNARLWVLGSARLYGDHVSLGKYGIAEASYEKQFVPYLLNSYGEIDDSVTFWGSRGGREKEELVSQAAVGIFNPCGASETFGLSGVEFEAMGIPVVSIYKNSAPDIIKNKETGLLYKKEREFPEYIIELLNNDEYNQKLGRQGKEFVSKEFDKRKITEMWHDAILNVAFDNSYRLNHDKRIIFDNQICFHHLNNFLKEQTGRSNFPWENRLTTGT